MQNIFLTIAFTLALAVFFNLNSAWGETSITEISSGVTAVLQDDGSIVTRIPTGKVMKDMEKFKSQLQTIDQRHPGPETPFGQSLSGVSSVNEKGQLLIDDGRTLGLVGLKCRPEAAKHLRMLFHGEDGKVAFNVTTEISEGAVLSYIWHADLSVMKDPELKDFVTSPSYISLNEIALLNGWCEPSKSASNKYHERYKEIFELGRERKESSR